MSFRALAFNFRMAHNTVAMIVHETCNAIWEHLKDEYMPYPTTKLWENVETQFKEKWNFPNCIGTIDGKHIKIKAPSNTGSQYFNYKHFFSVHLQAVADADCKFIAIDIGEFGRCSDAGVFKSSSLFQLINSNKLNIPPPKPLPGTEENMPHVFLGDQGYPLKPYLLRPYPATNLDNEKGYFNYRLSRARRCVECAFGILVSKWRCLKNELQVAPEHVSSIVRAACILHNMCIHFKDPVNSSLTNSCTSHQTIGRHNNATSQAAIGIREYFKAYFDAHRI